MKEIGVGRVASVMGRYYAMDRDKNWDRVKRAYDVLTRGEGEKADTATGGIQASYDREINDEFVVPFNVEENGRPVAVIQDKDSVIFFNFRPDRARELQEHSVTLILTVLKETKNSIWYLYVLPIMMRPSAISWSLSGKRRLQTLSENSWPPMERHRQE